MQQCLAVPFAAELDADLDQLRELFPCFFELARPLGNRRVHDLLCVAERLHLLHEGADMFGWRGEVQLLQTLRMVGHRLQRC